VERGFSASPDQNWGASSLKELMLVTTERRMFIFDTALFGELLSVQAHLKSVEGAN
jgi:hypothetical protein